MNDNIIEKVLNEIKLDVVNEQAILIVDSEYKVIYCNKVYEKLSGYSFEELKGKKISSIGVEDKLNSYFRQKYREKIKSGNCLVIFKNYKKNGEIFYILSKIKKIKVDDKTYYYGLVFDIDDIINDLSLFLFELDIGSVFFNNINERLVVSIRENNTFDIIFVSDLLKSDLNEEIIDKLKKFSTSNETKIVIKINNRYYKVVKFSFDYRDKINSEYIIFKFIDVTNEYMVIEEREKKLKLKQEFISSIIHDINTPLSAINGFVKFIKSSLKENLDDFCKSVSDNEYKTLVGYLNNISSNIEYLNDLMNDLLDLNKIDFSDNKIKINKSYFNINELLSLFSLYKFRALKKGLVFEINIDEELNNYEIYSDIVRIKQIISNLVSNSVKFTNKGYVRIDLIKDNNNFVIVVSDSGIGIDKSKIDKIFDLFEREDEKNGEGHGIGMFIVKNIVDTMKGEIHIDSEKGKGTVIRVKIPVKYREVNNKTSKCDKSNIKILIAEDDEIMRTIYEKFFVDNGYENLKFVRTCKELEKEIRKKYDLFVVDNKLEDCSAFEFVRKIDFYDKKIIFISGSDSVIDVGEFSDKMIFFLKKPFNYDKFAKIIDELLCKYK